MESFRQVVENAVDLGAIKLLLRQRGGRCRGRLREEHALILGRGQLALGGHETADPGQQDQPGEDIGYRAVIETGVQPALVIATDLIESFIDRGYDPLIEAMLLCVRAQHHRGHHRG
jgi:hypothetical protein